MPSSLRLRLAVWYAGLLTLILAATASISYSFHSISHYDDVDRSLANTALHVRSQGASGNHGDDGLLQVPPFQEHASPQVYVRFYDTDGHVVASSHNSGTRLGGDPRELLAAAGEGRGDFFADNMVRSIIQPAQPALPEEGAFVTITEPNTGERTRLYGLPVVSNGVLQGYLETGQSLADLDHSLERLRTLLTFGSLAGLMASLLGGWAIAGGALRPVATMAESARAIATSRGFSRRLPRIDRRDELGQLAETFNEMLESLDEAYRTQQRFIADASHELRAPLTSILGNLELLDRVPDMSEAEKREALGFVREEARRMTLLVSDLLVLARADSGQALKREPVELDRVLLDLLGESQARVRNRKLVLVDLEEVRIQGDPDRLKQLLLILLDNAIKYTPAGGEIRLGLHSEGQSAVVTIADTGMGMEPEDLPHIFERFYRADRARSRDQGGTGLGLSIAKWIVERHGGSISAQSTPGVGSTFTLRLPCPATEASLSR